MIINGASRSSGRFFARHLTNEAKNGRIEVCEIRGLLADSVAEAFKEMEAIAGGTRCKNYFYHANINPRDDEHLTPEQWEQAVDLLEKNLGLEGQPRFVVEHEKEGRVHRHIIWSRIDTETMKAISDSLTARIHEQTSRALEEAFDLAPTESVLVKDRDKERDRLPEGWEMFRAQETGLDPRVITAEVTELWHSADSGRAFAAALEERGYILAKGDSRDFCIIDQAGDTHSLARRIKGARAADVRARMVDIDSKNLPSVAEAREQYRAAFEEQEWQNPATGAPEGDRAEGGGRPPLAQDAAAEEAQVQADAAPFVRDIDERGHVREGEQEGGMTWWQRGSQLLAEAIGQLRTYARDVWQRFTHGEDKDRDSGPNLG